LTGSYRVQNAEGGSYTISGSAKLDLSEKSVAFAKVSRLKMLFIFFEGDLVVHEETVTIRGETDKYIEFSKSIKSETEFDSSKLIEAGFRATE